MSIQESARKARAKYKKKIQIVRIELYPTDADIKAQLVSRNEVGEPTTTYVKRLIRDDINRQ